MITIANKLKDLKLTSVDLVNAGANPDAHIRLFKRKDGIKKEAMTFNEELKQEQLHKLASEMFNFSYSFSDSIASIIFDDETDEAAKLEMMYKSLDEFAEVIRNAAPVWASGKCYEKSVSKNAKPLTGQKEAFEAFLKGYINNNDSTGQEPAPVDNQLKEEIDLKNMIMFKFDKSKMTTEEQAQLAELEKKYGVAEPEPQVVPQMHPDVKKALEDFEAIKKVQADEIAKQKDELEALRKRVEVEQLVGFAKKYELIGKKADELAAKLYDLKKAGGTAYDDYVALLDEHLVTVEKSGLFKELGKNTAGNINVADSLNMAAAELKKSIQGLNNTEALIKAFEENPELAAQYENEYMGGK